MTVRDSRTQARARTPGAEDDPTSTTVRDRALGPTQCGISDVATKGHEGRTQTKYLPVYAGSRLKLAMCGKAPSEMSALQPYRGKPAVRNDRGDRGNVGIIEARSAPRSYPTLGRFRQVPICWLASEGRGFLVPPRFAPCYLVG